MITQEERDEIIAAATERTLLMIPEVIGNLMASHAALHKINTKFYTDYPEFKDKRDVVQSVVEMVEGNNPLLSYEEILLKAAPEIKRRLVVMQDIDTKKTPSSPPRDFRNIDMRKTPSANGEI